MPGDRPDRARTRAARCLLAERAPIVAPSTSSERHFTTRCESCGAITACLEVHYRQNTGMLFMRQSKEVHAVVCRVCSQRFFTEMTIHNLLFGWWGTISCIVTPLFIIGNIVDYVRTRSLPSGEVVAQRSLEVHRDYALNLLGSKDEETVVDVLEKETRLPRGEVASYVRSLRGEP